MTFWAVLIPTWIGVNVALPPALEVARERRHLDCRDLWRWRRRWQTASLFVWATVAVGYWPGGAWGFPLVAAVSVAQIVSLATQRRPLVVWNLKMEFAREGLPLTVVWGNLATVLAGYVAHRSHDDDCKYGPRRPRERSRRRLVWPRVAIRAAFGAT